MQAANTSVVKKEKAVITLLLLTVLLIIFIGSLFRIEAVAKENYFSKESNQAEIAYRSEIKDILKTVGAGNSGIMMTKTSADGINFDYSVQIHMPEYINLNKMEKDNLIASLKALDLGVDNSSVSFSFS